MSGYLLRVGPIVYEPADGRAGFTLPEALRELRGTGAAAILRTDGTVVATDAGSDYAVTYWHRSGRPITVRRRPVRRSPVGAR